MKKHFLIIAFLFSNIIFFVKSDLNITTINSKTKKINHRFYCINILQSLIDLIMKEAGNNKKITINFVASSELVQKTITQINENNDWELLKEAWEDFYSYRHLWDPLFETDFSNLVFTLYNIFFIEKEVRRNIPTQELNELDLLKTDIDDVMFSFYTIQRIKGSITALLKNIDFESFSTENIAFENEKIKKCIADIIEQKNTAPLIQSIESYQQYRYAGDYDFLKEQLMLIFITYQNMIKKKVSLSSEKSIEKEMQRINATCLNIETFSIDQILDEIDGITYRMMAIQTAEKERQSGIINNITSAVSSFISYFNG